MALMANSYCVKSYISCILATWSMCGKKVPSLNTCGVHPGDRKRDLVKNSTSWYSHDSTCYIQISGSIRSGNLIIDALNFSQFQGQFRGKSIGGCTSHQVTLQLYCNAFYRVFTII